jgi:heme ABC exporter ATP-binding subunit CcmA
VIPDFNEIELTDVSRHYGRRRAVSGVALTVRRGDILGLLGPNGAGKSTLLHILATLVTPTTGTVRYGARSERSDGSEIRRRVGLLGHEPHLYPELSARQNLEFFARLYDLDPATVVPKALDAAGLADRADEVVSAFSRGMRQRLALERALLHEPRLALLDEPFTGLDDSAVRIVRSRILDLAGRGSIVVIATHDLDIAEGLVTRIAVLRQGGLKCDEPAGTGLRERYRVLVGAA